jgi:spore germination protein KC
MKGKGKRCILGLLSILFVLSLLSGCWQGKELNELAFVLGLGIDKAEDGYTVSMQVVIPSQIDANGGSGTPVTLYTYKVPTLYEALPYFRQFSPRTCYLGHVRVLVLGEELARSGIAETLDSLKRSQDTRQDYYVIVAKDAKAAEVLGVFTPLEKISANSMFNSVKGSSEATATTVMVQLDELMNDIVTEGRQPVLTGVEIVGTGGGGMKNIQSIRPGNKLRFGGVAVFRKDRLVGWLNAQDSIGFSYATDRVKTNSFFVPGDDGKKIVVEALYTSTKRKARVINGKPHIYLEVSSISNIESVQSGMDITSPGALTELERECEKHVVRMMEASVDKLIQQYHSDAPGFGQLIYKADPKAWRRIKQGPSTAYLKDIKVHYSANVLINRVGTMENSILRDLKE